jgi:hypothetical protein
VGLSETGSELESGVFSDKVLGRQGGLGRDADWMFSSLRQQCEAVESMARATACSPCVAGTYGGNSGAGRALFLSDERRRGR